MSHEPTHIGVVGGGVIGAGWCALFLARGFDVTLYDPAAESEPRVRTLVNDAWPVLTRLGLAPDASAERLRIADSPQQLASASEFIQECGPEDLETKRRLIEQLDRAAGPQVTIASSSSGVMPSVLQDMCPAHPERVLVGHPFNPVYLIPLVEVVPGRRTSAETVESALDVYTRVGKRPILVQHEVPGHVTNRLQAALWQEAYSLVERGVTSVSDIDAAISNGPGLRWALLGPLANQHLSGGVQGMAHTLEHLGPPAQEWMDDLGTVTLTPQLVAALVAGVDEELSGIDQRDLVAQRDRLLVQLIEQKKNEALP